MVGFIGSRLVIIEAGKVWNVSNAGHYAKPLARMITVSPSW